MAAYCVDFDLNFFGVVDAVRGVVVEGRVGRVGRGDFAFLGR